MILPSGAQPIIDARKGGMKPADLVLVSLIGPLDERNETVLAKPGTAYDWRWAVGLKICVFVNPATAKAARETLRSIGIAHPEWLAIWDVDRYEGHQIWALPTVESIHLPKERWVYKLTSLAWWPFQNLDFARGHG